MQIPAVVPMPRCSIILSADTTTKLEGLEDRMEQIKNIQDHFEQVLDALARFVPVADVVERKFAENEEGVATVDGIADSQPPEDEEVYETNLSMMLELAQDTIRIGRKLRVAHGYNREQMNVLGHQSMVKHWQ